MFIVKLFSFIRNSVNAHWQNDITNSHFVTVDYRSTSGAHMLNVYSYWTGQMLLPTLHPAFYLLYTAQCVKSNHAYDIWYGPCMKAYHVVQWIKGVESN